MICLEILLALFNITRITGHLRSVKLISCFTLTPFLFILLTVGHTFLMMLFWEFRVKSSYISPLTFFLGLISHLLYPLHLYISIHILHTVLYTFPKVPTKRIYVTIRTFFCWWSFPLFLWPVCLIQSWFKEKLDTSHSKGLKNQSEVSTSLLLGSPWGGREFELAWVGWGIWTGSIRPFQHDTHDVIGEFTGEESAFVREWLRKTIFTS